MAPQELWARRRRSASTPGALAHAGRTHPRRPSRAPQCETGRRGGLTQRKGSVMGLLTKSKVEPQQQEEPKVRQEDRSAVNAWVAIQFNSQYRINWDLLGGGEQHALVALIQEAREAGHINQLDRSARESLLTLIEKGCDLPDAYFERTRVEDRQRRETYEADAAARSLPFTPREQSNLFKV